MAQIVARQLAVRQARVQISARHPRGGPLPSRSCEETTSVHSTSCTLGGFNVSNLIGITRRMIDIRKKITFYFLQNV
jgi:hypothetical protein